MTLRPQYSLINSEFNEFLFAAVGDGNNGSELTVLSALTRLGFDPWGEAARLSDLPKGAAAGALAAALSALPEGDWKVSDTGAIAARLVDRLPGRSASAGAPAQGAGSRDHKTMSWGAKGVFCVVLAAAVLFVIVQRYTDHGSAPVSTNVSSTQR